MQHENSKLPPLLPEVAAVREALWFAPRNAGIVIELLKPKPGASYEGMVERTLVGSYEVKLICWHEQGRSFDVRTMLTVRDIAPNNPRWNDEFCLFMLQYDNGIWSMHIEPSESPQTSEDPCPWDNVYRRLTGDGVLAQEGLGEIRHPEALTAASTVGQFLAEIVPAA